MNGSRISRVPVQDHVHRTGHAAVHTATAKRCHRLFINSHSRNFCASSAQTAESSIIFKDRVSDLHQSQKTETAGKISELYHRQLQYRDVLTRVNGSTIYSRHSETRKIERCSTSTELKSLYKQFHDEMASENGLIPKFDIYNAFMRRAIDLDPSFHHTIFAEVKLKLLDPEVVYHSKETAIGKLFNNAMTSAMRHHSDTKEGLAEMLKIHNEFKTLCNSTDNRWDPELCYYPITMTRLISSCTMAGAYGKTKEIIEGIFERGTTFNYNKSHQSKLWNSILNYFAKIKDLESMEMYFNKMKEEYGVKPDDVTYSILIGAFAKVQDPRFETTFVDYIKTHKKYPGENVFSSLLNGYSFAGDIESCIGVLKLLLSKEDPDNTDPMRKTLPKLAFTIFVPIFKSMIMVDRNDPIPAAEGWILVEYLWNEMERAHIAPNEIIYGIVFILCGSTFFDEPNIDKMHFYYRDMTETHGLKPQYTQFKNLLKCGVQWYDYREDKIDSGDEEKRRENVQAKYAFVKWWRTEMEKYGVQMTNELKYLLVQAGCIGCIE